MCEAGSWSHQGGTSDVHKANPDSDLAVWGQHSPHAEGLNTGTIVAVPPALTLKP